MGEVLAVGCMVIRDSRPMHSGRPMHSAGITLIRWRQGRRTLRALISPSRSMAGPRASRGGNQNTNRRGKINPISKTTSIPAAPGRRRRVTSVVWRAGALLLPQGDETVETILIVDDEESVRRTFREWLEGAGFKCRILTAADAETALVQANQHTTDLAILDWNLGAGNDGLQLLEDLYLFNPDVVAILVTGFAHQATPLDAMRMGVRDYLDKNQELDRATFLNAVGKQLERIRPLKRERHFKHSLTPFREAVEKVLPLVQAAAALNDPVPLPEAIRSLLRFLLHTTGARDGVLLVRSYDADRQ